MLSQAKVQQAVPLTENGRIAIDALFNGYQADSILKLDVDDIYSLFYPDTMTFFTLIHEAFRRNKNLSVHIELTERAAARVLEDDSGGLYRLNDYLSKRSTHPNFKISVENQDNENSNLPPRLAQLVQMCCHHEPYERLANYMSQPQSDSLIRITKSDRDRYDSQGAHFITDLIKLMAEGRVAARTRFVFDDGSILKKQEADDLLKAVLTYQQAPQLDIYIPQVARNKENILDQQDQIYTFLEKKRKSDDDIAFSSFLNVGFFNHKFTNNRHEVVVDKGIAAAIYAHVNEDDEQPYHHAHTLQPERVRERLNQRRFSTLFNAAMGVGMLFVAAVGISATMKK